MNIAILGSYNTIFTHSYLKLLRKNGHNVIIINNNDMLGDCFNYKDQVNKNNSIISIVLKKILKNFRLDKNKYILKKIEYKDIKKSLTNGETLKLSKIIDDFSPDLFVFFWGTTLRAELKYIKENYPNVKKMLLLNTYPTRIDIETALDDFILKSDREYFSSFDKLTLPSKMMLDHFTKNKLIIESQDVIVCPDVLFIEYDKNNKNAIKNNTKKLIFLGNTNFSERTIDDISLTIKKLANDGCQIYIQESNDTSKIKHRNIKTFKPFTFQQILDGKLKEYIDSFNGVLYAYNEASFFRYNSSITTRLLLAEECIPPVYVLGELPIYLSDCYLDMNIKGINTFSNIENNKMVRNNNKIGDRVKLLLDFIER
ncbi:hypothetical protein GLP30_07590 [Photobacterium phosphoreum]|uniref:Uncharacterized protein n=1 Tax=Photobacterium phosphoreum TaxID=659 RepID=A0AAW4ZU17_PHOPO|nr:hypothetical protein [Photobacterium phosphoreum]MCD9490697.1 hypothetical protein [Photobacterium phosphoreum]MCF2189963.1 hypothetical protein [Photobacterium phosphoreum]MCF2300828.1 hypothetical protein [Photobacterium phosphoreum]